MELAIKTNKLNNFQYCPQHPPPPTKKKKRRQKASKGGQTEK